MLDLLVTTRAESFDRLEAPLADRGIRVGSAEYRNGAVPLSAPPWDGDEFDVGLVYPGRLMEGAVLADAVDVPWVNDREAVLTSRNKAGVLARLARAGVPTPETVLVSNPSDEGAVETAVRRVGLPAVVKPNSATRGTGVVRVPDRDSLAGVTDYLDLIHGFRATGDRSYLVQAFVPDARDYRVMVLDGEYAGAVERRGDGWKHNVHEGATAVGCEPPPRVRAVAERTASVVGVPYLGVDVLDGNDGPLVVETNARPTVDAEKYETDFYDRLAALIRETA